MSKARIVILFLMALGVTGCGGRTPSNREAIGLIGPFSMNTSDGTIVSVELDISFTQLDAGDLRARLHYDSDLDGRSDASVPIEPHLAHWDGGTLPERWSCPAVLDGAYRFRFDAQEETLTEEERAAITRFVGLRAGGGFYLEVTNSEGDAREAVRSWNVFAQLDREDPGNGSVAALPGEVGTGGASWPARPDLPARR